VLTQSAFNRRLRRLWGAFILIQDAVAEQLAQGAYNVMDGPPLLSPGAWPPSGSLWRPQEAHWGATGGVADRKFKRPFHAAPPLLVGPTLSRRVCLLRALPCVHGVFI
jgi:hypothetical protein